MICIVICSCNWSHRQCEKKFGCRGNLCKDVKSTETSHRKASCLILELNQGPAVRKNYPSTLKILHHQWSGCVAVSRSSKLLSNMTVCIWCQHAPLTASHPAGVQVNPGGRDKRQPTMFTVCTTVYINYRSTGKYFILILLCKTTKTQNKKVITWHIIQ